MTSAARWVSVAAPSAIASAKPWMEVSGVRRSWETESRNWRSSPFARLRLSAMVLIERASDASSG